MHENASSRRPRHPARSPAAWAAVLLLIVLYLVVRPMFEPPEAGSPQTQPDGSVAVGPPEGETPRGSSQAERDEPAAGDEAGGSLPGGPRGDPAARPDRTPDDSARKATARLGQLTDVGRGVKRSTAGLLYTAGSQEGHRLAHVLRHDEDQPSRPGPHGVFDGDEDQLLAVIDEAYLLVKQRSPQVSSKREGSRMVHEVNMRRRIGYMGGREGRRRNNPPATRVRLVLEDERLITAFPY